MDRVEAVTAGVVAVSRDASHRFSKVPCKVVTLGEGMGVAGDAHAGLGEARAAGHDVGPGSLGENILTKGLDLLSLATGTRLVIGGAILRLTGLRNPCRQINEYSAGLLKVVPVWPVRRGSVLLPLRGVSTSAGGSTGPDGRRGLRNRCSVSVSRWTCPICGSTGNSSAGKIPSGRC